MLSVELISSMIVRIVRQQGVSPAWEAPARNWARALLHEATTRYRMSIPSIGIRMDFHCWPERNECHVYISGGGGGLYQFVGTDAAYLGTYLEPTSNPARYLPLVYGTLIEVKGGTPSPKPLVSSAKAPPASEWFYSPDPRQTDHHLFCAPVHQFDGSGVRPHWYATAADPKRDAPWLVSQWQQSHPLNGFGMKSGEMGWYAQDIGYDFAPTLFEETLPNQGRTLAPASDWYQSAAYVEVNGTRFVVMVDGDNVFYCYPTGGYPPVLQPGQDPLIGQKGNVPAAYVKSQACPWPAEVAASLAPIGHGSPVSADNLRPLWSFAPDGTRAACIAAVREAQWGHSAIFDDAGTKVTDIQEDYPVLVEVAFAVAVTGPNPEDFSFSVALAATLDARTDRVCPVAVGYAVRPMLGGAVDVGDLLLLEYRHYTDLPEMCRFSRRQDGIDLYWPERPNKAVVATTSVRRNGAFVELFQYLVYYGCYPYNLLGVGDTGPRKFSPVLEDLVPSLPAGSSPYWNHFTYIAQHFSIDMSTLCIGLSATVCTMGWYPPPGQGTPVQYAAEGQAIGGWAFGEPMSVRTIGHLGLKFLAMDLLHLDAELLNLPAMNRLHLNSTIDYAAYSNATFAALDNMDYATMTATDGASQTWSFLLEKATENANAWAAIANCGLFPNATAIYGPTVYAFWDDGPYVRPGFRYDQANGTPDSGSISFTGYRYVAAFHRQVHALTTMPLSNVHQRIETHRNSSYAVFAGPFAAHPLVYSPNLSVPVDYEQTVYDAISIRQKDGEEPKVTTHAEMLAKAFQIPRTQNDYLFQFRLSGNKAEFRFTASMPTATPWALAPDYGPMGALHAGEKLVGKQFSVRVVPHYRAGDALMLANPSPNFSPFLAIPTPKLEGVFPFPGD